MATVVQRSSDDKAAGFRIGSGIVYYPDTDRCSIEISRGNFVVYFEDGHTDPAEVGFETLVEAQDFVAKSSKAFREGVQRPYRIEDTGIPAGRPIKFVDASAVHATPEDVIAENIAKEEIRAAVEVLLPNSPYKWGLSSDRRVEITLLDGSSAEKTELSATLESRFPGRTLVR